MYLLVLLVSFLYIAVQKMLQASLFHYFLVLGHCLVASFLLYLLLHSIFSMPSLWVLHLALPLSLLRGDLCSYLCLQRWGFSPSYLCLHCEQHLSMFQAPASVNNLPTVTGFHTSVFLVLAEGLALGVAAFHALAEGLALGVAAPKAYGLVRHMVLPVSLHGLPHGAAVTSCVFGATDSWHSALAAATLIGFVGPISAIGAILARIDYSGLDHAMVIAP
jgi:zinc transporter ZupT